MPRRTIGYKFRGKEVFRILFEQDVSQAELAGKLGVSPQHISNMLTSTQERRMTLDRAIDYANALNVDVSRIIVIPKKRLRKIMKG